VLVQTNYGGALQINGAPVGRELGTYPYAESLEAHTADGSIMIVVATDAPLTPRNLNRLASRAIMGLARTGSYASNGSGDYVLAFSTNPALRIPRNSRDPVAVELLGNEAMSPLFAATVEATEEAIYNAIFKATTVSSSRGTLEAVPLERLLEILQRYSVLHWDESLRPGSGQKSHSSNESR
jgi:D-aminopeptidase